MSSILRTLAFVTCLASISVLGAVRADAAVVFRPPTDAPVLDPFRMPDGPYGAGNRGIEYETSDGAPISSAAGGEVAFAGSVGGSLFVSIDHPGGLRSTYGFVANLFVRVGQRVDAGDLVALAGGPFHFTVRLDGSYVDPMTLFGMRHTRVTLIAHDPPVLAGAGGLTPAPATLLDGPFGPRTVPLRYRRNLLVRATPGRLGVPHELVTGKQEYPWQSSP